MRAHQIWTLGNVQENKNIYITVNPIFQIWISSPIALAGESANWQVSWDLSNVSFFHFFGFQFVQLPYRLWLIILFYSHVLIIDVVRARPFCCFRWNYFREKFYVKNDRGNFVTQLFCGFEDFRPSLSLSITHTNASVFCNSVWINQHGKYDKKAVICVFSALSLSLTPFDFIHFFFGPHDVGTHASVNTWRTNETDIHQFWLHFSIRYTTFLQWFCFHFWFCHWASSVCLAMKCGRFVIQTEWHMWYVDTLNVSMGHTMINYMTHYIFDEQLILFFSLSLSLSMPCACFPSFFFLDFTVQVGSCDSFSFDSIRQHIKIDSIIFH